jgi:hypothetical protein
MNGEGQELMEELTTRSVAKRSDSRKKETERRRKSSR